MSTPNLQANPRAVRSPQSLEISIGIHGIDVVVLERKRMVIKVSLTKANLVSRFTASYDDLLCTQPVRYLHDVICRYNIPLEAFVVRNQNVARISGKVDDCIWRSWYQRPIVASEVEVCGEGAET